MIQEFIEVDQHMYDMYQLMSKDLDELRASVDLMAPSVSTMGLNMERIRFDMNRGVNSFTLPDNYMRNIFGR